MKSKYNVEKRIADERFVMTIPGLDYSVGDEYYVLMLYRPGNPDLNIRGCWQVVAWAHTEKGAWSCRY